MLILVLGGARSGKSVVAEALAAKLPQPVTYVATLDPDPQDTELGQRIAEHAARRPSDWQTVTAERALPAQLLHLSGTVLLDSLGPWVARHHPSAQCAAELRDALSTRAGDTVVVSDEVGLSVHPTSSAGLFFRDRLGALNELIAAVANDTLFVVAGRVLKTAALDGDTIVRGGT